MPLDTDQYIDVKYKRSSTLAEKVPACEVCILPSNVDKKIKKMKKTKTKKKTLMIK